MMKKTFALITIFTVAVLTFSSCSGGYTCPTYMQDNSMDKEQVMVKETPQKTIEEV